MEKFLEKFQSDIEKKMLACARGESIVKPFTQVYEEVREKVTKKNKKPKVKSTIYAEGEESIYTNVIKQFLKEHPELVKEESQE